MSLSGSSDRTHLLSQLLQFPLMQNRQLEIDDHGDSSSELSLCGFEPGLFNLVEQQGYQGGDRIFSPLLVLYVCSFFKLLVACFIFIFVK